MSIVMPERMTRVLRSGLAEEADRQEREDNARGPEPERYVVTRTLLPVGPGWEQQKQQMPSLPLGFTAESTGGLGADEIRVRRLMIAAIRRWGWAR